MVHLITGWRFDGGREAAVFVAYHSLGPGQKARGAEVHGNITAKFRTRPRRLVRVDYSVQSYALRPEPGRYRKQQCKSCKYYLINHVFSRQGQAKSDKNYIYRFFWVGRLEASGRCITAGHSWRYAGFVCSHRRANSEKSSRLTFPSEKRSDSRSWA